MPICLIRRLAFRTDARNLLIRAAAALRAGRGEDAAVYERVAMRRYASAKAVQS